MYPVRIRSDRETINGDKEMSDYGQVNDIESVIN